MSYSKHLAKLVEEVRGWMLQHPNADTKTRTLIRKAQGKAFGALALEFLVFLAVLVWGANRPAMGADGVTTWSYSVPAVVIAFLTAILAPLCTYISVPTRDENGKFRMAAVVGVLGMTLVWLLSTTEFVPQTGLPNRVMAFLEIEQEFAWLVNVALFSLGIALFSVFNHFYREARQQLLKFKRELQAIETFMSLDKAVAEIDRLEAENKDLRDGEKEWATSSAQLNQEALSRLVNSVHTVMLSRDLAQLKAGAPHHREGKHVCEAHQRRVELIEQALSAAPPMLGAAAPQT